ncbi:Bifunctional cytochrome P450/NADPH--P450 reductase [Lachnellula occidentalis]|uniref:Bifunctional cytochrome P450/NADPH--P450 reductase n=1 Tax=Lachnellula occidentalis TaxID=215460 RepID=A0A8H8UD07_9HELO|nr:Bifunctional cytochrome P450/NADPH--P450 reductase [Lachnellula occidentalis]
MTHPIPGPPALPILGNAYDLDPVSPMVSLDRLAETYGNGMILPLVQTSANFSGEIFRLNLGGVDKLYISTQALMNEICDEKRFTKLVSGGLEQIRNGVGDGLFTAQLGEHNWEVAHRVLMPAFGPLAIRNMFDEMMDIATQMVVKWARFGSKEKIDVTTNFTSLTLDSIALCAMGTRFNSFYHESPHPFVDAMLGLLSESGARASRPGLATYLMGSVQRKYDADIATLRGIAGDLAAERRAHPEDKHDLLNAMLKGKDPVTGEGMTDESVINNMITFLIAGHETTSGMLSFLFYNLLKNPAAYHKAQKEIDEVIGRGPITVDHMSKLPYLEGCMRETLRLTSTAPAYTLHLRMDSAEEPSTLGGGNWKPFGNGMRGCIGRPFAWQEVILITSLLLQNFNFRFDDPSYQLQIKQTLTIKPKGFFMHASLRDHIDPIHLEQMLHSNTPPETKVAGKELHKPVSNGLPKKTMTILYGSNSGTCEALAQSLARTASGYGYLADVEPLDSAVGKVPKDQPVVLICSSYEGQPPDNAAHFVQWLENIEGYKLKGVKYAVFGVGNHDWVSTFHRIPKLLNKTFEERGATRIADIGLGDVGAGDVFNDFDKWQDDEFWAGLGGNGDSEAESGIDITIDTDSRRTRLRQDVKEAIVVSNEILTAPGEPEKRHIVLRLPTGMSYKVGDYLAVLPMNDQRNIRRVLKWANLPWDAMLTIKSGANTTLPTGHPISAMDVLGAYVELSQPATRKNVMRIAASCTEEAVKAKILALAGDDFETEITLKRRSPLDLLEEYPAAALPLGEFLAMLPPMRIRQYSISSSPLSDPAIATMTWSVLDTPSKAAGSKRFLGVASNYLSSVEEGDRIHVAVKPSHGHFHPPADIENTPVIMICAGTGLAPFRGFVQERAMQVAAGRKLAPAYLFIGCAHPDKDKLFKDELARWEAEGVVKIYYAFSRCKEESGGARHVQDRVWAEREEIREVFDKGAKIYVCGSSGVGEGVAATAKRIYDEAAEGLGRPKSAEEIEEWWVGVKSDRYASDVFA